MKPFIDKIVNLDSHHRLAIATAIAVPFMALTADHWSLPVRIVMAWNTFASCLLALSWLGIVLNKPAKYLSTAKLNDSSRWLIFLFILAACCMSLFAIAYLLGSAKGLTKGGLSKHVALVAITVIVSWLTIHTVFTMRYAHIYYGDSDDPNEPGHAGGLDFPDEENPDYLDFAYFSFIIGMTCQVSDVQISGRTLRRLALLHGMLTFAFNTVILALSLNIVSGLLSG